MVKNKRKKLFVFFCSRKSELIEEIKKIKKHDRYQDIDREEEKTTVIRRRTGKKERKPLEPSQLQLHSRIHQIGPHGSEELDK